MRFDLSESFPLITTKRVHFKSVAVELLWFLRGESNINWMQDHGVTIWNEWADAEGELGPVYGVQWRTWPTPDGGHIDQIAELMDTLKQPGFAPAHRLRVERLRLENMALPPCHAFFQFYVADGKLSCQLYQRCADMFLGVPSTLPPTPCSRCMVAQQVGLEPGEFVWTGGDVHIYANHMDQVRAAGPRAVRVPAAVDHPEAGLDLRLHAGRLRRGGLPAPPHD